MSNVFVLNTNKEPLNPVYPGRARILLTQGKAAVWKRFPFTIILKVEGEAPTVAPLRIKIDPGSKTTGLALVNDASGEVVFAAELTHRGQSIKKSLDDRRARRRSRRARKTRYRAPRFDNRRNKKKGWLPPSLESRIANVETWVKRLMRLSPISAISQELVKFDLQLRENAEISGVEYQQGTLAGFEVRSHFWRRYSRTCAYCHAKEVPLQIEHIQPRAKGGTDRVSNFCLACERCNQSKGTQDIAVFLAHKPDVLGKILVHTKAPLKDATVVNSTRWALYARLKALGLPVECGSGGLTKFNRSTQALPKIHWLDAACVGTSTPEHLQTKGIVPLLIKANGHGSRQMCRVDNFGFPRTKPKAAKVVKGFTTGDLVRAVVTSGVKVGTYIERVAVRASGSFNITTAQGTVQGISHRFCTPVHRCDGYDYRSGEVFLPAGSLLSSHA